MRKALTVVTLAALCVLMAGSVLAQDISARAEVDKDEVFLGEPFLLRIVVGGSDSPTQPDMSAVKNFNIRPLGGQNTNSERITIINGKMNRQVTKGYVFQYSLVAKQPGKLIIPSLNLSAEGSQLKTQPITVTVLKPTEVKDFKLRTELSKERCFVGEPVVLTVTWYIGKDVRNFQFNVPALEEKSFDTDDVEVQIDRPNRFLRFPVAEKEVIAEKSIKKLGGKEYTALCFKKVLIPRRSGEFALPKTTVAFEGLVGYRKSESLFDDFFSDDFFGRGRRGVYKKYVIPSNALTLKVSEVPTEGKPTNFAGHIGKYEIEAKAAPTEVSVGDPITLTIKLRGPEFLKNVELPSLQQQPTLVRDFKIPNEIASGKVEGDAKIFTQTIRATHPDVKEIPSIELPYFDTETGTYSVARTDPIPIVVRETKVVTAEDAEGREIVALKKELKTWREGIAYNYEDMNVLEDQDYGLAVLLGNPLWLLLTFGPPVIYFAILLSMLLLRHRTADPAARQAKKAYSKLVKDIKILKTTDSNTSAICAGVLAALKDYFGSKLRRPSAAITYKDIENDLRKASITGEDLSLLKKIFSECEAGSYAGGARETKNKLPLVDRTAKLVRKLERRLK